VIDKEFRGKGQREEAMPVTTDVEQARNFLGGEHLSFKEADALWERLKKKTKFRLRERFLNG